MSSTSSSAAAPLRTPSGPPRLARGSSAATGRSPLAVVFITVFLDLVGFGIVIPLLPLYGERFGAGPVAAAWLLAIYSLMQFFFAPGWGRLSDRIGRRPVLLVGLFGSAASYLAFGLAGSLVVLFVARAVSGMMGATIGVAQAYIADVTPPQDRARGMGMIGAAFGLGFIFGPAIGGLLSRFGPEWPFLGAALLSALNGIVAWFRLPESLPPAARAQQPARAGLRARLATVVGASPRLRRLYAIGFLTTLALSAVEAVMALWAVRKFGLTQEDVGYGFAALGLIAALAQGVLVGRLVKRMGERRSAMLGLALLALAMAAVPAAPTIPLVGLALAVWAIGQGAATPSVTAMISHHAGPAEQGRILAASQSLSALARALGPWWGGAALAYVGLSAPYVAASLVIAAAFGVLLFVSAVEVAR